MLGDYGKLGSTTVGGGVYSGSRASGNAVQHMGPIVHDGHNTTSHLIFNIYSSPSSPASGFLTPDRQPPRSTRSASVGASLSRTSQGHGALSGTPYEESFNPHSHRDAYPFHSNRVSMELERSGMRHNPLGGTYGYDGSSEDEYSSGRGIGSVYGPEQQPKDNGGQDRFTGESPRPLVHGPSKSTSSKSRPPDRHKQKQEIRTYGKNLGGPRRAELFTSNDGSSYTVGAQKPNPRRPPSPADDSYPSELSDDDRLPLPSRSHSHRTTRSEQAIIPDSAGFRGVPMQPRQNLGNSSAGLADWPTKRSRTTTSVLESTPARGRLIRSSKAAPVPMHSAKTKPPTEEPHDLSSKASDDTVVGSEQLEVEYATSLKCSCELPPKMTKEQYPPHNRQARQTKGQQRHHRGASQGKKKRKVTEASRYKSPYARENIYDEVSRRSHMTSHVHDAHKVSRRYRKEKMAPISTSTGPNPLAIETRTAYSEQGKEQSEPDSPFLNLSVRERVKRFEPQHAMDKPISSPPLAGSTHGDNGLTGRRTRSSHGTADHSWSGFDEPADTLKTSHATAPPIQPISSSFTNSGPKPEETPLPDSDTDNASFNSATETQSRKSSFAAQQPTTEAYPAFNVSQPKAGMKIGREADALSVENSGGHTTATGAAQATAKSKARTKSSSPPVQQPTKSAKSSCVIL